MFGLVAQNGRPRRVSTPRVLACLDGWRRTARRLASIVDRIGMSPEALAADEAGSGAAPVDPFRMGLLWRTGLHAEVVDAASRPDCGERLSAIERIMAADSRIRIGDVARGRSEVVEAVESAPSARTRTYAAEVLARIDVDAARGVLGGVCDDRGLLDVILSVAEGDLSRAERRLAQPATHKATEHPLLCANVSTLRGRTAEAVAAYNRFLSAFGLAPVDRRCHDEPLSTRNVQPAVAPIPQDGPLVSVVMPVRNAPDLDAALRSLAGQSWRNLDIVVVDDASDDNTAAVAERWCDQDPRVRVARLASNHGTYVARNVGLSLSAGEFITVHDGDDWSHPEKIARQVRVLLRYRHLVASISCWTRINGDGIFLDRLVLPLRRWNWSSFLFRRCVVDMIGGFDPVRVGGDTEFVRRLWATFGAHTIAWGKAPLALGGHRPESLTNDPRTGYGGRGISVERQAYWESWARRHLASMSNGRIPAVPLILPKSIDLQALRPTLLTQDHLGITASGDRIEAAS